MKLYYPHGLLRERHVPHDLSILGPMERLKPGAVWGATRVPCHTLFHIICLVILGPTISSNLSNCTFSRYKGIQVSIHLFVLGHSTSPTVPSHARNKIHGVSLGAPLEIFEKKFLGLFDDHEYLPIDGLDLSYLSA